jgi:hypothetical protein
MRKYAQNNPEAAARIIALMLIADRDLGKLELALLDELAVHQQLGLEREELVDGNQAQRVKRAHAGLLVHRIKWLSGGVAQHIGLNDLGRDAFLLAAGTRLRHSRRRVVQPDHIEATAGQFDHFPAFATARHQDAAWLQHATIKPS